MSIDAVVKTVIINEDGSGRLELTDRPARRGENDGIAGQRALHFEIAPEEVTALNWLPIWGGVDQIILGERKIAERIGYTGLRFVNREAFVHAVKAYKSNEQRNFEK